MGEDLINENSFCATKKPPPKNIDPYTQFTFTIYIGVIFLSLSLFKHSLLVYTIILMISLVYNLTVLMQMR